MSSHHFNPSRERRLWSRRALLRSASVALIPAGLPWVRAFAQPAVRSPLIDVHHHWYDLQLLQWWGRDKLDPNWTTSASLASMDEAGVTTAMLSVTMPGVWKSSDVPGSIKLARHCNEAMTQTAQDHHSRFGVIAAIPLPQVDAALAEIAYALDVLKVDAIGLLSSYEGQYLGDTRFAPVFQELNRRQAVVYVHPMAPTCCTGLVPNVGAGALEAPTDTTRTVESLLVSGTLSRWSALRMIVAAGGGTLPFVGERLLSAAAQAGRTAAPSEQGYFSPESLRSALASLHLDIAGVTNAADWAALMNFTTPSQLLFGTDFPFNSDALVLGQLRALEQRFGLSGADSQAIEYGNALRLFPARLKAASSGASAFGRSRPEDQFVSAAPPRSGNAKAR